MVLNTQYLAVYVRKDRDIEIRTRGGGEWALVGRKIAVAYLPPHIDHNRLEGDGGRGGKHHRRSELLRRHEEEEA